MSLFLCNTLTPEIFWIALSAVGTLAAVCTALFFPLWIERREIINMGKIVELEIQENTKIIEKIISAEDQKIPNGTTFSSVQQINLWASTGLRIEDWEEYKYKIAIKNPKQYKKYEEFNNKIKSLKNFKLTTPELSKNEIILANATANFRLDIAKKLIDKAKK